MANMMSVPAGGRPVAGHGRTWASVRTGALLVVAGAIVASIAAPGLVPRSDAARAVADETREDPDGDPETRGLLPPAPCDGVLVSGRRYVAPAGLMLFPGPGPRARPGCSPFDAVLKSPRLDEGTVFRVVDRTESGGVTWYCVDVETPEAPEGRPVTAFPDGAPAALQGWISAAALRR